jgi:hypothetical protein
MDSAQKLNQNFGSGHAAGTLLPRQAAGLLHQAKGETNNGVVRDNR